MPDDNGEPPPAINWSLVDDDQEWRRREGSKSAPPKLNVSGFPAPDNLFFDFGQKQVDGDEFARNGPEKGTGQPPLNTAFQDFINSVTKLTDSPEATPSQSLQSSFSSLPNTNASFTSLLLKYSSSQPSRLEKDRRHVPFALVPDSPAMQPADGGALPIRIPGFGTSPQTQSFLLGTPPASLASLGGEPYLLNNSPSVGSGLISGTLAAPQATWPRPEGQTGKSKKDVSAKPKNQQRLTFQESKEQQMGQQKGKLSVEMTQTRPQPQPDAMRSGPHHKEARGGKGAAAGAVERRLFPALEGEIDGHLSSLDEVIGNIYPTAKDQYGCRFLQKMLEDGSPQHLKQILDEVYDHCIELMTDPFGNYLMQKLVEFCNDEQRTFIAQKVAPQLVNISLNMHGTRAVQTLIEHLSNPVQVDIIIDAFHTSVVPLIKDLNGNHVIQRCLQKFSAQDKQFIYDAAIPRCMDVATHRHGCCVIQRCIDHASEEQRAYLTDEIARNAFSLVTDPFGNYVVQYVLDLNIDQMIRKICSSFVGSFASLCMNKFSSNVMEKCLQLAPDDIQHQFIAELMEPVILPKLLQDQYANHVVQTALTVSKPHQFGQLQEAIRVHLHLVRNTPYGKKIENKLNRGAGRGAGGGRGKTRAGGGAGAAGGNMGRGYGQPTGHPNQMHNQPRNMGHSHATGHMPHNHQHHMAGLPHHMQMQGGAMMPMPMAGGPRNMPGMGVPPGHPMGGKAGLGPGPQMMPMGAMDSQGDVWDTAHGHPMYWP
eukprot:GGOE01005116.1.p1 GENE.GGOE01005116.1~~GGOE01005116.1.p1  ORF type:complete len:775 (+),score=107.91 GGOE01005116.1:39-2327(+)